MGLNPLRKRQLWGTLLGLTLGGVVVWMLSLKSFESYLSLGPMNTGHENLSCNTCHVDAKGNLFQQVTSNVKYTFGSRKESVDFGTLDVDNKKCLVCHERKNDRHPTHRFLEPRFKDAVKAIDATKCETCHKEHNGVRVVLDEATFCQNCHYDLEVKEDPLDIPHDQLIADKKWSTCLQCHDFHGNHIFKSPTLIKDTISIIKVRQYLKGGQDPFATKKKYLPMTEEDWKKLKKKL